MYKDIEEITPVSEHWNKIITEQRFFSFLVSLNNNNFLFCNRRFFAKLEAPESQGSFLQRLLEQFSVRFSTSIRAHQTAENVMFIGLVLILIAAILEISSKICAKETSTIQSMVIRSGSANVTPPWRCLWTQCKLVMIVILCVCVFSCFVCVCFDYQWSRLSSSVCVFWIKSCASMVSCVQSLPPPIISATWWSNLIITITLIRYVMCFSLILLSVDLSSPHVKNKMSKREFIRNTRGAVGAEGDKSLIVGYKLLFPLQWVEGWRKTSTEAFTTTFSCEAI